MVSALITVAVIAWCAQLALAAGKFLVLTVPSTHYARGRVRVGRPRALGPQVVVAITLDNQQRIVDTLFIKRLTIFARPQKIPAITGMHAGNLRPDVIFTIIHYHRKCFYHWRLN
ncbi:transcriptional regulator GutM [Shigella flexneri]